MITAIAVLQFGVILYLLLRSKKKKERIPNFSTEHQLRTFLQVIPDFMYIKDTRSRFVAANVKNAEVMNLSSTDKLIGKTDHDFYPKEMADKFRADEEVVFKYGKPLIGEIEDGIGENGKKVFVSTTKMPIHDDETGEIIGLVGIGRDVTKVIEYEHELIKLNSDLQEINNKLEEKQRIIEEQKSKLEKQKEELEQKNINLNKLNATKDKLFSIIAHDLKNPLNAVLGYSELLVMQREYYDEEKKAAIAESIFSSAETLVNLLEGLLEWSRAQKNNITVSYEQVNLKEILEENVMLASEQMKWKDINLTTNLGELSATLLKADKNIVNTVFRNILSNAIKYTPREGKVDIRVKEFEDCWNVSISDSGIGMDEEVLEKLFVLSSLESQDGTEGEKGSGLGLVLSHDFLTKMNGKISVESEINKGSTFKVSLPKA